MQQLTDEQQTDNLSEYRIGRFAYYQQAIDTEYVTFKAACAAVKCSSLRMCELLHAANQERIWAVDGYDNMTQWVNARWPEISKVRLSQMLAGGAILEEYDTWTNDELTKNGNLLTLPRPENEGQLRAMNSIQPDARRESYESAVISAGGSVPSAREISEAYLAKNGKESTDERISRLDFGDEKYPSAPIGAFNTQASGETVVKGEEGRAGTKRPFGYIDPDSISTSLPYKKIFLTVIRPAVPDRNLREMKIAGLTIPFHILVGQGWQPPTRSLVSQFEDEEPAVVAQAAPFAGKTDDEMDSTEDDDPPLAGSFIADRDLSYADAPAENIALDAMNKMFADEYSQ